MVYSIQTWSTVSIYKTELWLLYRKWGCEKNNFAWAEGFANVKAREHCWAEVGKG